MGYKPNYSYLLPLQLKQNFYNGWQICHKVLNKRGINWTWATWMYLLLNNLASLSYSSASLNMNITIQMATTSTCPSQITHAGCNSD